MLTELFKNKRSFIGLLCALAVSAVVLCGCPPKEQSGGTGDTPAKPEVVKIGYVLPLSGRGADYGAVQQKAIEIALAEVNKEAKRVEVVYEDSQLDPTKALTAAERLVSVNKVNVLFGFSSGETLAVAGVAKRSKLLLVAPMASSLELDEAKDAMIRLAPSDAAQAEEVAKVVRRLGHANAAILHVNDVWGKGLAKAFETAFQAEGGKVATNETCEPGATDFRAQLTKVKSLNPAVFFIPVPPDEALPLLRQAKDLGVKSKVFGGDTFSNEAVYADKSKLAEGVVFALPADSDTEAWKEFSRAYKEKNGNQPDINGAAAYDAVKIIAEVAQKAASLTAVDLRKAVIDGIQSYVGATGEFSISAEGIATGKRYGVFVVKGGAYKPMDLPGAKGGKAQ